MPHLKKEFDTQLAMLVVDDWYTKLCAIDDIRRMVVEDAIELYEEFEKQFKEEKDSGIHPNEGKEFWKSLKPLEDITEQIVIATHKLLFVTRTDKKDYYVLENFVIEALRILGGVKAMQILNSMRKQILIPEKKLIKIENAMIESECKSVFKHLFIDDLKEYKRFLRKRLKGREWKKNLAKGFEYYGMKYGRKEQFEMAKKSFEKAVELNPKGYTYWIFLGQANLSLKEYKKAEEVFRKASEKKPESAIAWEHLGHIYFILKEFQKAKENYLKAIKYDPKHEGLYNNLSMVYINIRELQEAENTLKKVLEINPKNEDALRLLERLEQIRTS
ncbi:MAG: tetratricopeptide repeat protein [Candidatus Heimdallarchaeota archaeon]